MGREIRRCPPDWRHPKDAAGHYIPLYDGNYLDACEDWWRRALAWQNRIDPTGMERPELFVNCPYYWDWDTMPPDQNSYRERAWTPEEATAYQVYENVSEGTPISPVFATKELMREWLIAQGERPEAVDAFIEGGWAPSMVVRVSDGPVEVYSNIDSLAR